MIKPDHTLAARKLFCLHNALEGVLMCCSQSSPAYDLAINVRAKLRDIHRLITGNLMTDGGNRRGNVMVTFNKEELEIIEVSVRNNIILCEIIYGNKEAIKDKYIQFMDEVLTKIDKMIDLYCEHKSTVSFHEQFLWQQCNKCGVVYK